MKGFTSVEPALTLKKVSLSWKESKDECVSLSRYLRR